MKTVHLMGIGGSGMASLAGMFAEKGWKVRGSDQKIYPPASTELAELKIPVLEGFKPENLEPKPDLVIVGNVISRGNPEAEALLTSGIPYTSMAQALAKYFLKDRRSVVVTGTHGKTTTTSLLAWILDRAGQAPGLFVGGGSRRTSGVAVGSGPGSRS
ncbi:MAG: Mur ligase domain-containing protein [Pseudomonadota bacterium]